MNSYKRITCTEWIYAYEENNIIREIDKFCEEKSKEVLNFRLESHSILKNIGSTSHSLYEGTYTSPNSFDIYITYSYDYEEDDTMSTYICSLRKNTYSNDTLLFQCQCETLIEAIYQSTNYFSRILGIKVRDKEVICTLLEDIPKY